MAGGACPPEWSLLVAGPLCQGNGVDPNIDPDIVAGVGTFALVIGALIYLATLALSLWIGYLIMKAAVRNALREHTMWLESRRGPLR
jgi:hypothetical protein